MIMCIVRLIFCFLILVIVPVAHAGVECKPIASIYGQDICEADIAPSAKLEESIREYATKAKESPSEAVENFKMSSLFGLLWEKALVKKYGADAIEPSSGEVKDYLKSFHAAIESQNDMNEDMSTFVSDLLENNNYAPEEKQRLKEIMAEKQKAIMMYNMREAMPDETRKQMEEGERKMSEAMVKSWKIKKTLFEDYGGRVVFQQAGLEPLDAFQTFVKELEDSGAATIHDPAYKKVFRAMDQYTSKEHQYLPEDSEEIEDYFDSPSWVYDSDMAKKAFKKQKAGLEAIPVIEPAAGE